MIFSRSLMHRLKQIVSYKLVRRFWIKRWILGRHACLGKAVIDRLDSNIPVFNIQKGRVDYWISCYKNDIAARSSIIKPHLTRGDLLGLIEQQEFLLYLPKKAPDFIFMDSLSELADQLFLHRKNKWSLCAYYSDLDHSDDFKKIFSTLGLLPIDQIESSYRKFFDLIRNQYKDVPIVYLHFPKKLETRKKFIERHDIISEIINRLAEEYLYFYSISVDESIVKEPEDVIPGLHNFPYHYNDATYLAISEELMKLGVIKP